MNRTEVDITPTLPVAPSSPPAARGGVLLAAAAIGLVAVWLRFWNISATFESSDQAAMAYLVRHSFGFRWILAHDYGPVLPLIHLIVAGVCRLAGWPMGEAVARLPMAIIGLVQVVVTIALMHRLGRSRTEGLLAAAVCAVLPTLVAGAHYPWDYNKIWLLTGTLALWATLAWLDEPRRWRMVLACTALALHCLSGLYSMALPLTLLLAWAGRLRPRRSGTTLMGTPAARPPAERRVDFLVGFVLACLVVLAVIAGSWYLTGGGQFGRLLGKTEAGTLGWHPEQILRLPGLWVSQLGYIYGLVAAAGLVYGVILLGRGRREGLLSFWAIMGLLPLLLLALWDRIGYPAHYLYEVVYPSALLGVVLLAAMWRAANRAWRGVAIMAAILGLGQLALGSAGVCLPGTPFRTFTGIATGWGNVRPDTGVKAAGLYVREHVPADAIILALHTNHGMELPVAEYYLGRKVLADYILPPAAASPLVDQFHATVDVFIVEAEQAPLIESLPAFRRVATFNRDGEEVRLIYARRSLSLPKVRDEIDRLNARYDERYRPRRVPLPLPAPDHFTDVLGRYQEAVRASKDITQ